jgi:hypothetical protein
MDNSLKKLLSVWLVSSALAAGNAWAGNITIFDGVLGGGFATGSPNGTGVGQEDQENQPGSTAEQAYDLEAFYLDGNSLTLWAGYNLGKRDQQYNPGDIFIDVGGDAVWGATPGLRPNPATNVFGWDYVIAFAETNNAYSVYSLDTNSLVQLTTDFGGTGDSRFDWSNPWRYGTPDPSRLVLGGQTATLSGPVSDSATPGLLGGTHYSLTVDVGFLGAQLDGAVFSYTMQCGNDDIKGRVPDGGTTVLLLGLGLAGLAVVNRRFRR